MDYPEMSELVEYFTKQAAPATVGVVTARGVEDSIASESDVNNWLVGAVGFSIGVAAVKSNIGEMGKSFGSGIAIGSAWELLDVVIQQFTKYNSLAELLYSPVANGGNGGS